MSHFKTPMQTQDALREASKRKAIDMLDGLFDSLPTPPPAPPPFDPENPIGHPSDYTPPAQPRRVTPHYSPWQVTSLEIVHTLHTCNHCASTLHGLNPTVLMREERTVTPADTAIDRAPSTEIRASTNPRASTLAHLPDIKIEHTSVIGETTSFCIHCVHDLTPDALREQFIRQSAASAIASPARRSSDTPAHEAAPSTSPNPAADRPDRPTALTSIIPTLEP